MSFISFMVFSSNFFSLLFFPFAGFFNVRFGHFSVEQRSERNKNVGLYQGVEQRKQHADHDWQNVTERLRVVDELGYEKSAEQRAEQTKTHGNGQRKIFERIQKAFGFIRGDTAAHDKKISRATPGDGAVDIG